MSDREPTIESLKPIRGQVLIELDGPPSETPGEHGKPIALPDAPNMPMSGWAKVLACGPGHVLNNGDRTFVPLQVKVGDRVVVDTRKDAFPIRLNQKGGRLRYVMCSERCVLAIEEK